MLRAAEPGLQGTGFSWWPEGGQAGGQAELPNPYGRDRGGAPLNPFSPSSFLAVMGMIHQDK